MPNSLRLGAIRVRRELQWRFLRREVPPTRKPHTFRWIPVGLSDPEDADRISRGFVSRLGIEREVGSLWDRKAPTIEWEHCAHSFDFAPPLATRLRDGMVESLAPFEALVRGWTAHQWPWWHSTWDPEPLVSRVQNCLRSSALLHDVAHAQPLRDLLLRIASSDVARVRSTYSTFSGHSVLQGAAAMALADSLAGMDAADPRSSVSALWRIGQERIRSDGTVEHASPSDLLRDADSLLEVASVVTAAGATTPLSVQVMLARTLRAARLLCRPSGQPHAFRPAMPRRTPRLSRLDSMSGSAIAAGLHETVDMFTLPSGGYAGIVAANEKMIIRFAEVRALLKRHPAQNGIAIEYCVDGELALISDLSDGDGIGPEGLTRDSRQGHHPWRIESLPFVFDGSARGASLGALLRRRVEQLGTGAWRITDRAEGSSQATCSLYFDVQWNLAPTADSGWVARHAGLQHGLRLTLSPSDANTSLGGSFQPRSEQLKLNANREGSSLRYQIPRGGLTWTITVVPVE
jgi:Uncharacterized protein conserved in bacteria